MMRNKDDVLREAIEFSKYWEYKDSYIDLRNDNLSYSQGAIILLAREVVKFRPDLLEEKINGDIVYIVRSGSNNGLPSVDLTSLMENEKPYDDAVIGTYSLSQRKFISILFKGNGISWEPYKE